MARRQSDDPSSIAGLATRALEACYLAACGEPPRGARAWRDGSNLLLVLRPGPGGAAALDCETLPARIAESVRVCSGRDLRDGRWRSEPELGIEMFVFGLPAPARDDGAPFRRVPAWQRWSPVPVDDLAPAGRRR
jgi:hypothetical protein